MNRRLVKKIVVACAMKNTGWQRYSRSQLMSTAYRKGAWPISDRVIDISLKWMRLQGI